MKTKEKEKLPILFHSDTREPLENYNRYIAVRSSVCNTVITVRGDKEYFVAFLTHYKLSVNRDKIFWKKIQEYNLTYKVSDKTHRHMFYGNIEPFVFALTRAFKLDWIPRDLLAVLGKRKDLWIEVISGRITNQEKLLKYFSKKYFRGVYSYRTLLAAYTNTSYPPLWDLYYYCANPEIGLKTYSKKTVYHDILFYCKVLNEKYNPLWSDRRLKEYHQYQIEKVHSLEAEEYSNVPIIPHYENKGINLILDERSCFIEGQSMHNCVHSYWNRIKNGKYILARGFVNDEYINMGITSDLCIDQIHTKYNGVATEDTLAYCRSWLEDNKEELSKIVEAIKAKRFEIEEEIVLPF